MASNVNNGSSVPPNGPINGPQTPANLGVNTTVVADATKKRKQAGFEKVEVKRSKQENGPQTKEEKERYDLQRFRLKLSLWYNSPNGADYPPKNHPLGILNGRSAAVLVLRARDAPVLSGSADSWAGAVRVKLDMFSQAPCLRITLDSEHSFVIHPANIIKEKDGSPWTQTHDYKVELGEDKIVGRKSDLAALLASRYQCPCAEAIDGMFELSKSGSTVKVLSILGFDLGGEFTWETKTANTEDPRYDQMKAFMTKLNQGAMHAVVVRSHYDTQVQICKLLDNHWISLMERCRIKGPYSFYKESIGTKLGQLFEAWQGESDAEVQHQPWMMLKGMDEELRAYASHDSRKAFGSLREMEIALSLCIIHENMWENYSISKYFNNFTKHKCRADRAGDYTMLHVGVDKDENFVMPSVPAGTRMKFWVVPLEVDEDAEEPAPPAEEWIKVRGKKVRKPVMPARGWMPEDQVTKAQAIEVATDLDFVLGFRCNDENSRNAFKRGNRMEIWIEMERNPIPSNRMLKAIGRICSPPKNAMQENLQKFLMGHGTLNEGAAIHTACRDGMSNDQKNAFDHLSRSMDMNKQQLQAWKLTFYEAAYACFIQGPPGTGKTNIVGGQGVGLALCGVKTLITAPSNIAAREIMNNLISKVDEIAKVFPQIRDWFDIIYLPTRGTTISDLKETDIDWDTATLGMIQEGENQTGNSNVDNHALWKHIVRTMRDDIDNGGDQAKKARAKEWLDVLAKFKSGQSVANGDKRRFAKTAEKVATEILSSQDSKVKIVVCTCNTADVLHEYGYKPEVCIGDEAAFGFEADFWIPLLLGSYSKIINVGDHMQLQPVVKSHGHSEYSKQLGLSIFARFFNHYSVRTAKFRLNYRMPKEIAEFPGMVSYEYLGSHPSTARESATFKYIKQWWNSDSAKPYRDARRDPEFGGAKDLQI